MLYQILLSSGDLTQYSGNIIDGKHINNIFFINFKYTHKIESDSLLIYTVLFCNLSSKFRINITHFWHQSNLFH